ncbi:MULTISPECIES: hypothetical protein [unclassified Methylobacterium]|nr:MULTISPECIES: hypothetical protein [unclassified Methylobacterium]SEG31115.1 hypothetical protein SAMN04488144_113125 [Methylobacterium sp. 190mf]
MDDGSDPAMEAETALRAADIAVWPIGDELEHWQIANLVYTDADV